jgi:hypothetical protein
MEATIRIGSPHSFTSAVNRNDAKTTAGAAGQQRSETIAKQRCRAIASAGKPCAEYTATKLPSAGSQKRGSQKSGRSIEINNKAGDPAYTKAAK